MLYVVSVRTPVMAPRWYLLVWKKRPSHYPPAWYSWWQGGISCASPCRLAPESPGSANKTLLSQISRPYRLIKAEPTRCTEKQGSLSPPPVPFGLPFHRWYQGMLAEQRESSRYGKHILHGDKQVCLHAFSVWVDPLPWWSRNSCFVPACWCPWPSFSFSHGQKILFCPWFVIGLDESQQYKDGALLCSDTTMLDCWTELVGGSVW